MMKWCLNEVVNICKQFIVSIKYIQTGETKRI